MDERLYRSSTDRVISGVAGGLAAWLRIDPSIVRVAWVLAAIFSAGIALLVYFVMMIVVPLAPAGWPAPAPGLGPGSGGVPGWNAGAAPAQGAGWTAGTGWSSGSQWPSQPAPGAQPAASPDAAGREMGARRARLIGGTILIILGTWSLIGQYVHIDWNLLWPVVVMAAGVVLIAGAVRRTRS